VYKRFLVIAIAILSLAALLAAQTTTGLLTGQITDSTGAVLEGAQLDIVDQGTNEARSAISGTSGIYIIPQLQPGVYRVSVKKQGFATVNQENVQIGVNQNVTIDFTLQIASTSQSIEVTGTSLTLNTTSATLGDIVDHQATVDLPLNGREFTQLALLTPGASPVQGSQQGLFSVALGSGGVSPSVNGQKGTQNNYTMDGVLNNSIYTNSWAIAPPPDAIQEFNVQTHITDAEFAISSGANINVVTRSGTNDFHGSFWEFLRNDALDSQTFPATLRLPYRQNQYGLYSGGPILVPHLVNGKNNTWYSFYWEGYRSDLSQTELASTLTSAMQGGDFSAVLGAQVGTDSLGRPEYANEIYDPNTSRPDPDNPGQFLRDPFSGNVIPASRINPASQLLLQKYYPQPNLPVAAGVLPNLQFTGRNTTASDVFGLRLDHQFTPNDALFVRFNRSNGHFLTPEDFPSYHEALSGLVWQAALGYTHLFGPKTILGFHFAYTYTKVVYGDEPAGQAFTDATNFSQASPAIAGIALGPNLSLSNGYNGVSQFAAPIGPQEAPDSHADLSKIVGKHTIGIGGMYYHIRSYDDGWDDSISFTQNATAQDASTGPTGFGPASLLLGTPDSYSPYGLGNSSADQTVNWWGFYGQDTWQVTPRLSLSAGLRWDYVAPPNFHKIVSGLDVVSGQFIVTGAVPPYFDHATGPKGFFYPQHDGFQPRLGINYRATLRTVLHGAAVVLDDHDNTLVQENQNIRLTWPLGIAANFTSLDLGMPTTYFNSLPPLSSLLGLVPPTAGVGEDANNPIPYSIEYNVGVEQELSTSLLLKLGYVGALSRHQYIYPTANMALMPAPGPISARQPFPQYGGPFGFSWNEGPGTYNALEASLQKSLSSGLSFRASYTFSKSLDWASDPYINTVQNFYDLKAEWGPSDFSMKNMFVLSGVYALPVGNGKRYMSRSDPFVQEVFGDWNVGAIISHRSGQPFDALAGGDVANVGNGGAERAERTGDNPYLGFNQGPHLWLNPAAFAEPAAYTYGNERKDDLVGPDYDDVDFNTSKDFPLKERLKLQFRAEFFKLGICLTNPTPRCRVRQADTQQTKKRLMNSIDQFENRASIIRSKHEGESSYALCDRLSRTRATSPRQLPTDHDYAVSTCEYQTDQSSLKPAPNCCWPCSRTTTKATTTTKTTPWCAGVDRVTPYQGAIGTDPENGHRVPDRSRAAKRRRSHLKCRIDRADRSPGQKQAPAPAES
jgi:hypothetical protein